MSCTYIMFHCYVLGTTCIALLAYCHDIASYTDTKVVHLGLHFAANPLTCTTFGSQNWSRRTNFGQDFFYDTTLMCICMYPAINASKHYETPANEAMVFIYVPKTVFTPFTENYVVKLLDAIAMIAWVGHSYQCCLEVDIFEPLYLEVAKKTATSPVHSLGNSAER